MFIDIALAISPKLKIETYDWIFDKLIQYRNNSGDSFKKMCGALYNKTNNKSKFQDDISRLCEIIKKECGVDDWQTASVSQLKYRDKIHENVSLLTDVLSDIKQAIKIGIQKAKADETATRSF